MSRSAYSKLVDSAAWKSAAFGGGGGGGGGGGHKGLVFGRKGLGINWKM